MSEATQDPVPYEAFADRIVATGILTDPWIDGCPRFREAPVFVSRAEEEALYRAAERVAAAYNEAAQKCADDPTLLDSFFGLTPYQKLMWLASAPLWHGLARADAFFTENGIAICELNADTPTGQAEAVVLNQLALPSHADCIDPNTTLADRLCAVIQHLAARVLDRQGALTVGLVYPTEMTEDLSLVRLYRGWFEARGWEVVLGSPFNLAPGEGGRVTLFGRPLDVVLRHYKTDWWGERTPVWNDAETFPDPTPLTRPLQLLIEAMLDRKVVVLNPFGAVLTQNKRMMAFLWEHLDSLSAEAQAAVRDHIPETTRLEVMHPEQLVAERDDWVLKSDYGAEGDEVIVGRVVTPEVWAASLAQATPGRWIAQRHFAAVESASGESVNHGVFLVAGEAAGLYARVQQGPTDVYAESAPTLVTP